MTIDEYAQWAATARKPVGDSREQRLAYLVLGLIGEAGELADSVRKMMRGDTLDENYLADELGDTLYHWACLCTELGHAPLTLLDQRRRNIEARLAARETPTRSRHG
jgi:NTP pyrophosphatase (non-canonical NTP hydrolase)